MLDAVVDAELHRLHELELVFLVDCIGCLEPDFVRGWLECRLDVDETVLSTERIHDGDLEVGAVFRVNQGVSHPIWTDSAQLMPEHFFASTSGVNLRIEETLLAVKSDFVLAV